MNFSGDTLILKSTQACKLEAGPFQEPSANELNVEYNLYECQVSGSAFTGLGPSYGVDEASWTRHEWLVAGGPRLAGVSACATCTPRSCRFFPGIPAKHFTTDALIWYHVTPCEVYCSKPVI